MKTIKKFTVIQWIGGEKFYVSRLYAGRTIVKKGTCDAIRFTTEEQAIKYIKKLQSLNEYGEFNVRQFE